MSDSDRQNYELAFHISSNLDEADIQKTRQEVEKTITSNGGVVSFAKDPEKFRLGYPIQHQTTAFFGYFNFSLENPEESLVKLRDELRLNHNILRFLILKLKSEARMAKEDVIRKLAMAEKRRVKAAKQTDKPVKSADGPKLDEKAVDDKLDEIIEKL